MIEHTNTTYPSGAIFRKDPLHSLADSLNRQEVNLEWYLENAADKPLFMYTAEKEMTDPWDLLDGVDRSTDGETFWVWTVSGQEITASPRRRFFMQTADIELTP